MTITSTITTLADIPSRNDAIDFNKKMNYFNSSLSGLVTDINALVTDYNNQFEKGTFTPQFSDDNEFLPLVNHDLNIGHYYRINDVVFFMCHIDINSTGTLSGTKTRIGGLPFVCADKIRSSVNVGFASGLSITALQKVTAYIDGNTSKIKFRVTNNGASFELGMTNITSNLRIWLSGQYEIKV